MLKIASYNLNGIRSALQKNFAEWLTSSDIDIICIQETKVSDAHAPIQELEALGFHSYWHFAERKGYSGVAILTKIKPLSERIGCGIPKYDREGRIISLDFGGWTLMNCYFPSGSSGEERHDFKMEFLNDFLPWINKFKKTHPNLIVVGDYNIVHGRLDIHNPDRKDNPSGYRPEERAWMDQWFESGFTDAFRFKNPEAKEYSWWSFRAGSRSKNLGWRIDYQSVSDGLKDKIVEAYHLPDVKHADHCPVVVKYDL